MCKNLSIRENKQFLKYHNKKIPNTIHKIKKKALKLMIKMLCKTNCDINDNYKHFLSVLHRKKMISPNNKCIMHRNRVRPATRTLRICAPSPSPRGRKVRATKWPS